MSDEAVELITQVKRIMNEAAKLSRNKRVLTFVKLGDFYEAFFKDAETVSEVCQITLTRKQVEAAQIPMCGVPAHAIFQYIQKLTAENFRVCLAESTGSPVVHTVRRENLF